MAGLAFQLFVVRAMEEVFWGRDEIGNRGFLRGSAARPRRRVSVWKGGVGKRAESGDAKAVKSNSMTA